MWQRERLLPVFGLWLLFATPAGAEPGLASEADLTPEAVVAPVQAEPASAAVVTEPASADAVTKPTSADVLWRGLPLPVSLVVGQERRIDFPEPMADLDVPQAVTAHSRLVLTPTGQLHWQAREPFPAARVLATSVSGTLYQLDVHAAAQGDPPPPLVIRDPVVAALTPSSNSAGVSAAPGGVAPDAIAAALIPDFLKHGAPGATPADRPDYVALTRFALAHYVGPARAIPSLDASPAPVPPMVLTDWLRVQDALLAVRPLASWKIGAYYVTALDVVNRRPFPVDFDPRALRGDLRFVAALHPVLAPAGSGHQHTVWAVVTDQPFHRAVAADVAH